MEFPLFYSFLQVSVSGIELEYTKLSFRRLYVVVRLREVSFIHILYKYVLTRIGIDLHV